MKNLFIRTLLIGLMTSFMIIGTVLAGDNISLTVSMTLPVIPGVNAPAFEKEPEKLQLSKTTEAIKNENKIQSPEIIQEETKKDVLLTDGKKVALLVQTVYSR